MSRIRADIDDVLSRHTGHPVGKIRADTDRRRTFNAREAVDYGLADRIVTSRRAVEREWVAVG